jgi:transcriptional regulator with XRE-family HTH domain
MLDKFSSDLRKLRESKNLSIADVTSQTKLHIAFIENLEKGNFEFQPQPYIRAFLKQYAKAIGYDQEKILYDYDLAKKGNYVSQFNEEVNFEEDVSSEEEIKPKQEIKTVPESDIEKPVEEKKPLYEINKPDEEEKKKAEDEKKIVEEDESLKYKRASFQKKESNRFRREHFVESEIKPSKRPEENLKDKISAAISPPVKPDKKRAGSNFSITSPIVKNILLVLFVIILLVGLYSIVNILLTESSNGTQDVRKQSFDDIVKEQEQRFLGKRSEEEIQDSIKRAEEERLLAQEQLDSITLKVISIAPGTMTVAVDSSGLRKPVKVSYGNNEIGIFKAKHFFVFSNDNTASVKVTLNDTPIEFPTKKIDKVRITRDGVEE